MPYFNCYLISLSCFFQHGICPSKVNVIIFSIAIGIVFVIICLCLVLCSIWMFGCLQRRSFAKCCYSTEDLERLVSARANVDALFYNTIERRCPNSLQISHFLKLFSHNNIFLDPDLRHPQASFPLIAWPALTYQFLHPVMVPSMRSNTNFFIQLVQRKVFRN